MKSVNRGKAEFTLSINDPREGWKYAKDVECKTMAEVFAHVTITRAKHKRFTFALRVQSGDKYKTFVWRRSKFIGLTDNVPVDAWLGDPR